MRRTLLAVLSAATMMLVIAGPAAAVPPLTQAYPPLAEEAVVVSDSTLVPGEEFVVSSSGWLPGSTVTFTLFSEPTSLGSTTVDADTSFSATLEIPTSVAPGTHTVQISGASDEGDPRVEELTVEVLAAGSDDGAAADDSTVDGVETTANELAFTGANLAGGLGLAAILLVAGAVTVVVSRRRRGRVTTIEQ